MVGVHIPREDLFRYSEGHFFVDEDQQFARHYVKFDIEELCKLVALVGGNKVLGTRAVRKIHKMDGDSNKTLIVTFWSGKEVVVKIPCPNAGLAFYTTASEVAVMEYGNLSVLVHMALLTGPVKYHTSIPVPRILAWSSDASNPIGCEYIILEQPKGFQLLEYWTDTMNERQRLKLLENITKMEHQLASIRFPAYGNLFFRDSIAGKPHILLDPAIDPLGRYCIGPACDMEWYNSNNLDDVHAPDIGPCKCTSIHLCK